MAILAPVPTFLFSTISLNHSLGGTMQISMPRTRASTALQSVRAGRWRFRFAAATDVGSRRQHNEDFFILHPDRHLYLLADGMGGHAGGEVASRVSAETVVAYFDATENGQNIDANTAACERLPNHLVQSIKRANASIFSEAGERSEHRGMGTTIVTLTFCADHAHFAHVGDSRLYRLRHGELQPLTRDHSLLQRALDFQDLSEDEARELIENFPHKNVLTRALGSRYVVDVDVDATPIEGGDLFVMTSDGVHDTIDDEYLNALLVSHQDDWNMACDAVIAACNDAGGPDNITIVCVETLSLS